MSRKKGKEVWLEPEIDQSNSKYRFKICRYPTRCARDIVDRGTKAKSGGFRCILTGAAIPFEYIRTKGREGKIGHSLLAVVAEPHGKSREGREYTGPTNEHVEVANSVTPCDYPISDLPSGSVALRIPNYGYTQHWQMFTSRQLNSMVRFSDTIKKIGPTVTMDARASGMSESEATDYSKCVLTFLALALNRLCSCNTSFNRWLPDGQSLKELFAIQNQPMIWDYAEANPLGAGKGSWTYCIERMAESIPTLIVGDERLGKASQTEARNCPIREDNLLICTDPPYYDNIRYAVLSDFFYIWLRRTISHLYKDIFKTVLVPKDRELTAARERFDGDKVRARDYFEAGFRDVFSELQKVQSKRYPLTIYYAFKQSGSGEGHESESGGVDLTSGWETLLSALISSGFQITSTWPVHASQPNRMVAMGANALASYIVLSCRTRDRNAKHTSRREFLSELKSSLPRDVVKLQENHIAPVDIAQAALGLGMSLYSRHPKVLEADGRAMTVRSAISEINRILDETIVGQETDLDLDTRFCIAWFEQYGFSEQAYGVAETLMVAKNVSFERLSKAGIVSGGKGKFRLKKRNELKQLSELTSTNVTDWGCLQELVQALTTEAGKGVDGAACIVNSAEKQQAGRAGKIKLLAYRAFSVAERKGWAEDAHSYNILVRSWQQIQTAADKLLSDKPVQGEITLPGDVT